jgi:hypothetical protein
MSLMSEATLRIHVFKRIQTTLETKPPKINSMKENKAILYMIGYCSKIIANQPANPPADRMLAQIFKKCMAAQIKSACSIMTLERLILRSQMKIVKESSGLAELGKSLLNPDKESKSEESKPMVDPAHLVKCEEHIRLLDSWEKDPDILLNS